MEAGPQGYHGTPSYPPRPTGGSPAAPWGRPAAAAAPALPRARTAALWAPPGAPARCLAVSFMLSPSPSLSPTQGKRERAWAAAGRLPVSQAAELQRRRAREKEGEQLSEGRGRLLSLSASQPFPGASAETFPPREEAGGPAGSSPARSSPVSPPHTPTQRRLAGGQWGTAAALSGGSAERTGLCLRRRGGRALWQSSCTCLPGTAWATRRRRGLPAPAALRGAPGVCVNGAGYVGQWVLLRSPRGWRTS